MQAHGQANMVLNWVYDVDLLWRKRGQDIDWEETLVWARRLSWEAALHAMLKASVEYFSTPISPAAGAWLEQDASRLRGFAAVQRLAVPGHARSVGVIEAMRVQSWSGRLHYLARMIAPHPSYMRYRYHPPHPSLLPFTYPYRWLDSAGDLFTTAYRSLLRR